MEMKRRSLTVGAHLVAWHGFRCLPLEARSHGWSSEAFDPTIAYFSFSSTLVSARGFAYPSHHQASLAARQNTQRNGRTNAWRTK